MRVAGARDRLMAPRRRNEGAAAAAGEARGRGAGGEEAAAGEESSAAAAKRGRALKVAKQLMRATENNIKLTLKDAAARHGMDSAADGDRMAVSRAKKRLKVSGWDPSGSQSSPDGTPVSVRPVRHLRPLTDRQKAEAAAAAYVKMLADNRVTSFAREAVNAGLNKEQGQGVGTLVWELEKEDAAGGSGEVDAAASAAASDGASRVPNRVGRSGRKRKRDSENPTASQYHGTSW